MTVAAAVLAVLAGTAAAAPTEAESNPKAYWNRGWNCGQAAEQFNVTLAGRTRTRYVRQGERAAIEAMVASYRRLWALVDELTEVNLALLHTEPPTRAS